jgi:membrane protein implicated in regulation of membrane protease activity
MPTQETETNPGVGPAAKQVAEHASSLARLEMELAALELKKKIAALGIGIGLAAGAALFVVFGLWFIFATIAAGLATTMSTWLALLITTGIVFALAAGLAIAARGLIRKGTPPVPEQAIEEAKRTTEALKHNGTS